MLLPEQWREWKKLLQLYQGKEILEIKVDILSDGESEIQDDYKMGGYSNALLKSPFHDRKL